MKDVGDEFEEFETTEGQIDAMMGAADPVDVAVPGEPRSIDSLYIVTGVPMTAGGATITRILNPVAPTVQVAKPAGQAA